MPAIFGQLIGARCRGLLICGRFALAVLLMATACSATPAPASENDAADGSELSGDATADAVSEADIAAAPTATAPDGKGKYVVGTRSYDWFDAKRKRAVATQIWYPCLPQGDAVEYLHLLPGSARQNAPVDPQAHNLPILLFSHGFRGINVQSFSILEHIAAHGYIVVAPNHDGNTLGDNSKDAVVAQVSLERPLDLAFALTIALAEAQVGGSLPGLWIQPALPSPVIRLAVGRL